MSEATSRKTQVAGLHFFNPVHRMELVEVVRGQATTEQTIHQLVSFVKALGKTPIVTTDTPGFLVNRVLFPYLGEAVRMVQEGMSPQRIDRQIRRFGMPMGPLELLDQVGLDVAKELYFTGRMISGTEAAELGVATRVSDDPHTEALDLAKEIAEKNPEAIRRMKTILNGLGERSTAERFAAEREHIGALIGSPNQVEAVSAFFEKRTPRFS